MKYIKSYKFYLFLVLLLGFALRFYLLDKIPPHLTPDEAALGYNAYSIFKTGKDEHGVFFPIVFESFGDFKPGLYVYLTIPFVALFGLTEFATRAPSALLGVISVYLVHVLVLEATKTINGKRDYLLSLISAFFLAISPWHIHFSRGAWEINLSLTLTILGMTFAFAAFNRWKTYLILSIMCFSLTLLAYQGAKLSTSIVVIVLIALFNKKLLSFKKQLLIAIPISLLIVSPILASLIDGRAGRLNVFSIFSYPRSSEYIAEFLKPSNEKTDSIVYFVLHNEPLNIFRGIMGRYANHFSFSYLFMNGDTSNPRHSAPYSGQMLISDFILLLISFVIISKKINNKYYLMIVLLLILAPLPSVLSRDQVHAVRSYQMVLPLVLLSAIGAQSLFLIKNIKIKNTLVVAFIFILSLSFIYYLDQYFNHLSKNNSKSWEYGYKQVVEYVFPLKNSVSKIVVQQYYSQPYIYFLFYTKYDPLLVQKYSEQNFTRSEYGDVGLVKRLVDTNIYFESIDWQISRGDKNSIFVADPIRIPAVDSRQSEAFSVLKEIMYLNNIDTAFRIIKVK